ncbi:hypothetical protein BJY54_002418 [Streptomyces nodosus]|nr:hypothetical protein [Streptomyces nodosus]
MTRRTGTAAAAVLCVLALGSCGKAVTYDEPLSTVFQSRFHMGGT